MDQPGNEALKKLALAEDYHRLVAGPPRKIVEAFGGLAEPDEVGEELGAAAEQKATHRESRGEGDRSDHHVYGPPAFLSSAVTAGTISVRSPITA